MKYTLALRTGGLMEYPGWHYKKIRDIEANSIREAKQKYAELTELYPSDLGNDEQQTYWGWSIVGVSPLKEIEYPQ
jgi:hypothetical protein